MCSDKTIELRSIASIHPNEPEMKQAYRVVTFLQDQAAGRLCSPCAGEVR